MRTISAALAALAMLGSAARAEDTVRLAVGQRGNWDTSVSEVGQRAGIFKKHGLVLDIVYTQGSGETQQAVISGSVDIGVAAGVMGVLSAYSKGAPVRVIGADQYQNIQDARLSGMEFETYYDAGLWFAGLAGTHGVWGRDVTNNLPLATIPPDQITTTLGARFLDRRLTVAVRWQSVRAKNPNDIPPGAEAQTGAVTGPPYF